MQARELIHKLLYQAFLDIRYAAHEKKGYAALFKIANSFHNIPLQLEKAAKGEREYQDILEDIKLRANRNDCLDWLNNAIKNIDKGG